MRKTSLTLVTTSLALLLQAAPVHAPGIPDMGLGSRR
jgi:hypothetical protein